MNSEQVSLIISYLFSWHIEESKTEQDRQTDVTVTYLQATSALRTEAPSIQFSEPWDLSLVRNPTNQTDASV
jgi:hypothetical protein